MGFDRIDGDRFHVTHDALASLVGARRSGVTNALHVFEGKGLIRSHRNEIILRDVEVLREAASGTYGLAEREYARLIGVDFRRDNKSAVPHHRPELFHD